MITIWLKYRIPNQPTIAPIAVSYPPVAPTAAPTADDGLCFSSQSKVLVQNVGEVPIHNLQVGTKVLTANGYQTFYGYVHENHHAVTEFLQIHTQQQQGKPLEVSKQHLVFLNDNTKPVPAHLIRPGDVLQNPLSTEGNVVQKVTTAKRKGIYAPLTTDGTIVVDVIE